jgi:hypothetical protein
MELNDPAIVAELEAASDEYERALAENDIVVLDALFHDGPEVVRYGVAENLYGAEEIAAFRRARTGGAPPRAASISSSAVWPMGARGARARPGGAAPPGGVSFPPMSR